MTNDSTVDTQSTVLYFDSKDQTSIDKISLLTLKI